MIKNETQYRQTKAQIMKFEQASRGINESGQGLHPIQKKAYLDAMRSQQQELVKQIEEYELLKNGQIKLFQVNSFDELPITLIKARIASGLTQKDLAQLLGMKEQQVQRYEATNYESASFDRLKEVVNALGIKVNKEILISENTISFSVFFKNLESLGFKKDFVLQKLLPSKLASFLDGIANQKEVDLRYFILQASAFIGRIFNISPSEFLNPNGPTLNLATAYATKFKKPKNVTIEKIAPYTIYAHTLAISALDGCKHLEAKPVPTDVHEFRQSIIDDFGEINFETVLRYAWSLGIPVLPLGDSKNFHGACWRTDGRNVIVIKQKNKSSVRWLFDLIHELCHAGQYPELSSLQIIETSENFDKEMTNLEDEKDANWFAGQVLLNGKAHILSNQAIKNAGGDLRLLSSAVSRLSKQEGIDPGALANFIAFRLSAEQGKNWWGAATNLQVEEEDPLEIAKKIFLENIRLEDMAEFEQELILNALK